MRLAVTPSPTFSKPVSPVAGLSAGLAAAAERVRRGRANRETIPTLENWLVQAQEAIRCRQEAMRANFEQAVAENLKRLWGKVRADPSALSSEMIQAALGKASQSSLNHFPEQPESFRTITH